MKIKFLGTGGCLGTPQWNCNCKTCTSDNPKNFRLRPALLVEIDDKNILIDFGQDIRYQLIKYHIKKLDYAFLTHVHRDHQNGMEQLSLQENIKLWTSEDVLEELLAKENGMLWIKTRNPSIDIDVLKPFSIGDVKIDLIKLIHQKDYIKKRVACTGYLFKSAKFSFAYLSDYNDIIEKEKLYNLDLIISDGNNWKTTGTGHVGIEGAIKVYNEFKPKQMLLTHLNHTTEHTEVEKYTKQFGNIAPAYDGLEIEI